MIADRPQKSSSVGLKVDYFLPKKNKFPILLLIITSIVQLLKCAKLLGRWVTQLGVNCETLLIPTLILNSVDRGNFGC